MSRKKVALLLDNTLTIDRRALLEVETLSSLDIELHLFCMKENNFPEQEQKENYFVHRIFTPEIYFFRNKYLLQQLADRISESDFDVLHCHDRVMLHVGTLIRKKNKSAILVYESRELFHQWPMHVSAPGFVLWLKSWMVRKLEVMLEKKDGSSADYLITVNQSIADILQKYFSLKTKAVVTRNIPRFEEVFIRSNYLREIFSIPVQNKILVYIGAHIYRNTLQMEQALEEFSSMQNLSVVIITGNDSHSQWFREWVKENNWANIFFHDLIPVADITKVLSGCDAGIVSAWNKKDLSYWFALDNKIFSYIMAEIPVLATAQPEYQKAVEGNDCGVCINPEVPGAFAHGLKEIFRREDDFKPALKTAKHLLCWEEEQKNLLQLYTEIIS